MSSSPREVYDELREIIVDNSQGTVEHIAKRFALHFALSTFVFGLSLLGVRLLLRFGPEYADEILAVVLVFAITGP